MRLHTGGGIVAQMRMDVDHAGGNELAAAIDPVVAIGGQRGIAHRHHLAFAEQHGAVLDHAAAPVIDGRAGQRGRAAGIGRIGRCEGHPAVLADGGAPVLCGGRGHAVAPGGGTSGNRECGRAGEQGNTCHGTPNAVGPEHRCPGPCGQLHFVGAIKRFADWRRLPVSCWGGFPDGSRHPAAHPGPRFGRAGRHRRRRPAACRGASDASPIRR